MFSTSPFSRWPFAGSARPAWPWLFCAALLLGSLGMALLVGHWGALVEQRLPQGVLSLELPWHEDGARRVLAALGDDGRQAARRQTLADFGLLLLYPLALALSCELLSRPLAPRIARAGVVMQWLLLLTGPLDALENVCILLLLDGTTAAPLPQLCSLLAATKFAILLPALAFLLLALALRVPRRGWWLSRLIQLLRLHVLTLLSLAVGVYFFAYSQPARELWEDALDAPRSGPLALIVLGAFGWIASLWWALRHAQIFFLDDVRRRHGIEWPQAPAEAPDDHGRIRHLMAMIPAVVPLLGLVAIVFGAAANGLGESDKAVPALTLALLAMATLGSVSQWRWASLDETARRQQARQLMGWQWALGAFLAVLGLALGDSRNASGLTPWRLALGIGLPLLIATLATAWLARRASRGRVAAAAVLRGLASMGLVLHAVDIGQRVGPWAALVTGLLTAALEWGYLWLRSHSLPAQAKGVVVAQWVEPAAGPKGGLGAPVPLLVGAVLFAAAPVGIGTALGSLAVAMLALAAWTLCCALVFISLPLRLGLGPLPLLMPVWLLLISPFTDNHRLPHVETPPVGAPGAVATPATLTREPSLRADLDFEAWLDSRHRSQDPHEPIYLVAASGGGVRAAYWTAMVLARLDDQSCGEFGRQTYAISGVSGGSVGAAVYVAAARHVHERQAGAPAPCTRPGTLAAAAPGPIEQIVYSFFERDLMAPLLGSMLFPDGLQRFLPAVIPWGDRGGALEQALEQAWFQLTQGRDFEQPLTALYADDHQRRLPILVLNATNVADGRRVQVAPVLLQDPLAYPLFSQELRTHGLRLSTAVHNSARFPVISPPGTVLSRDGEVALRIVDGGYFENSAAAGATALYRQMRGPAAARARPITLVLIENDPGQQEPGVACGHEGLRLQRLGGHGGDGVGPSRSPVPLPSQSPPVSDFGFELGSVLSALLGARSARGPWHQQELATLVCESPGHRVAAYFYGNGVEDAADTLPGTRQEQRPEPALSWSLSRATRAHMKQAAAAVVQARGRRGDEAWPF